MRGVILLAIIIALFSIACGAGDELPTVAATAAVQEAAPPATTTDIPGDEVEPTATIEPTDTRAPEPTATPEPSNTPEPINTREATATSEPTNTPLPPTNTPPYPPGDSATVVGVIDGDTIDVDIGGTVYRVRYIGMDTPEQGMPYFDEATQANANLVAGQTVILVKDVSETDQFGRLLRYVYLTNGTMVNAELVRQGYAQVATYPPDVRHQDLFSQLQETARNSGAGLWGVPTNTPIPPTNTPAPVQPTQPPPQPTQPPAQNCDPSYPTVCIPPYPPDLDCGEIPYRRFEVLQPDPHGFDGDNDGVGCESG
jgi:micrococcal nuclease